MTGPRALEVAQEQHEQADAGDERDPDQRGVPEVGIVGRRRSWWPRAGHDRAGVQGQPGEVDVARLGSTSRRQQERPRTRTTPIGRFTKNMSRQVQCSRMKPPRFGPRMPPIGRTLVNSPTRLGASLAVMVRDDADGRRHQAAAADRLERARGDQEPDRGGQAAQQRAEREHADAEQEDLLAPERIAELAGQRQHDHLDELIRRERPADQGSGDEGRWSAAGSRRRRWSCRSRPSARRGGQHEEDVAGGRGRVVAGLSVVAAVTPGQARRSRHRHRP